MVCEGFTGNVVLKMAESVYDIVNAAIYTMNILTVLILKLMAVFRC